MTTNPKPAGKSGVVAASVAAIAVIGTAIASPESFSATGSAGELTEPVPLTSTTLPDPPAIQGASVEFETISTIGAPGVAHVAEAVVPLPPGTKRASVEVDGRVVSTQADLVGQTTLWDYYLLNYEVPAGNGGDRTDRVVPYVPLRPDKTRYTQGVKQFYADPAAIVPTLELQNGEQLAMPLTAAGKSSTKRIGLLEYVEHRWVEDILGMQWYITVEAGRDQVQIDINLHQGEVTPARGDLYFKSVKLTAKDGWTWSPAFFVDPAMDDAFTTGVETELRSGFLVKPGSHILPQRYERPFRVTVQREGLKGDLMDGAGVASYENGGWGVGGYTIPDRALNDKTKGKEVDRARAYKADLIAGKSDEPGFTPPPSELWPGAGTTYGGMTGGHHVFHHDGARFVLFPHPETLDRMFAESMRYRTRHPGCLYEGGSPVDPFSILAADGTADWRMFNRFFEKNGGILMDPFNLTAVGVEAPGTCAYEDALFQWQAIDYQHYIRSMKANWALALLFADPLAIQYNASDALLGQMAYWHDKGPARRFYPPEKKGLGAPVGRGEAWVMRAMSLAFMFESDRRTRANHREWFEAMADWYSDVQMPSGLWGAQNFGKMATSPPYGDENRKPKYFAHRMNEQQFTVMALHDIACATGIDLTDTIVDGLRGIVTFGWMPGRPGTWTQYVAGFNGSDYRFASTSEWDDQIWSDQDSFYHDGYHNGTTLSLAAGYGISEAYDKISWWATGGPNGNEVAAANEWGWFAKSKQGGAPIENWITLIPYLTK